MGEWPSLLLHRYISCITYKVVLLWARSTILKFIREDGLAYLIVGGQWGVKHKTSPGCCSMTKNHEPWEPPLRDRILLYPCHCSWPFITEHQPIPSISSTTSNPHLWWVYSGASLASDGKLVRTVCAVRVSVLRLSPLDLPIFSCGLGKLH
jgi:hypothetical protein